MLQFITHPSEKYSYANQAQMVIDGGCRWIELRIDGATDTDIHNAANELIPICRDTETFLVINGHIDVVDELKVSGIHLEKNDVSPAAAREKLGAHAIIGVSVETAADIIALKGKDIDYITLPPMTDDEIKAIVDEVRAAGVGIHIVATGNINSHNVNAVMATGVSGVAVGRAILDAELPGVYTAELVEKLGANA